ncbi:MULTISPECIES: sensor histidine kinase [Sphingobacterium]|uniref:sensor histidine kinase n=1 Tax=Sphingobacterium TaxID=28453 RepID=UPI002579D256|nr:MULTISPECIES: HAMP domain-containing sensor histidine kinase [Sphingobacterium]
MELKPKNYIILFILFFAILIGIQGYQLYNTYRLKQREIFADIKKNLDRLEDSDSIFDNNLLSKDIARDYYIKLVKKEITAEGLKNLYKTHAQKTSAELTKYVDSIFRPLGMHVILRQEILGIYYKDAATPLVDGPITVYTTKGTFHNPTELSSSKWLTEKTETNRTQDSIQSREILYVFSVPRKTFFEVVNLNWILFKELTSLLLSTLLILAAFIWLFYRTINNLRKQKKQIAVLHDVVDNISHELKTPIATLKIAARTLQKSPDNTIVAVIERQVSRLEQTLDPLNESQNATSLSPTTAKELQAIFNDFQLCNPTIKLIVEPSPNLPICLNPIDTATLFSNLMNNAVKYGATQLNIRFEEQKDYLSIQVNDNGQGMEESELPYIFEKFYRIQKDNIHDTKGLGIGLFLVRNIVKKYAGKISVISKLRQGTTFVVLLPR